MLNQHKTIRENIAKYNKENPLVDYLLPYIKDSLGKKSIAIADIGSGPFCKIGHYLKDVPISLYACDSQDFTEFYKKYGVKPFKTIDYQNMEALTYPDNTFTLVHCANALDHTKDAKKAVEEMIRICKPGGWVYIDCNLFQLDTGGHHYWNANMYGTFSNEKDVFNLDREFGFKIEFIDNGGEQRYNRIIATLQK